MNVFAPDGGGAPMEEPGTALALPACLDIGASQAFYDQLTAALRETVRLDLIADQVERITTPCIQIILSVAKFCEAADGFCRIVNPAQAVQSAFLDLGLISELQLRSKTQ